MDSYSIVLIVHLLCAIAFVGFIFADVLVFPALQNKYGEEKSTEIKQTIYKRGVKIYPVAVLMLIGSGGYMFSKYINSTAGYFTTPLQQLLWLKFSLVLLIVFGVIYALSCKIRGKEEPIFMKNFHKIALILSIFIVILAKMMFVI